MIGEMNFYMESVVVRKTRYNIGDWILLESDEDGAEFYGVITDINNRHYFYEIRNLNTGEIRNVDGKDLFNFSYGIQELEEETILYARPVPSNKIAKKIYRQNIKQEKDGKIWVAH